MYFKIFIKHDINSLISTRVDSHSLLQGIFLAQRSNSLQKTLKEVYLTQTHSNSLMVRRTVFFGSIKMLQARFRMKMFHTSQRRHSLGGKTHTEKLQLHSWETRMGSSPACNNIRAQWQEVTIFPSWQGFSQ